MDVSSSWLLILCSVVGYLIGSISPSILISRRLGGDIREHGSRNAGSSNMLRIYGAKAGLLTFALDFVKGAIAVLLGKLIAGSSGQLAAGLFCVLGHDWPVFFGFHGGKGVACSAAVYVLTVPSAGILSAVLCLAVICWSRYISLGSMVMAAVFALCMILKMSFIPYAAWALLLMLICVYRHRKNISRIIHGTENKISFRSDRDK